MAKPPNIQFIPWLGRKTSRLLKLILVALFALGVVLVFINIVGLIVPLRNPSINDYVFRNKKEIAISYQEALSQIDKYPTESETEYVYRLNHVVNQSMASYWSDEGIDTYRMRVPIWENYILWWYSFKNPRVYLRYEFNDYQLALERGIGLCSQHAIILEEVLEKNGIQANIIGMNGHVVASAKADGKWFIVDADNGIVMPYSIEEIEQNPDIVPTYYKDTWNPELFASIYKSKEDNIRFDNTRNYTGHKTFDFEQKAYAYKWLIPIGLMIPFGIVILIQVMSTALQKRFQNPPHSPVHANITTEKNKAPGGGV